jgi:ADP-ribosylglycohydrolase
LHDEEALIMRNALMNIIASERRPGSGFDFQIASVHMAPCVLWCVCRHASHPRRAIQEAIALGGDTDTTATMVGAVVGALHGDGAWCASWASGLENGSRGRDYALRLAEALAALDITGVPS